MVLNVGGEGFGSRSCLRCSNRESVVCEVCLAPYCSTECQKLDWPAGHVVHCKPVPGSIPSATLANAYNANTRASRAPNGMESSHFNSNVHRPPTRYSGSSSRSDSGERNAHPWMNNSMPMQSKSNFKGGHGNWTPNSGLGERKSFIRMDPDPLNSTLNGAAPVWRPKPAKSANFMGIPDDIWNNTIRSCWPATESTMRINVLSMGAQCGGYYDFSGIIDGTPETFLHLQQLEIQAAEYAERVKEAYIPTAGDLVLAKYDGMFYRAVAINHKKVWFVDYGNFAEVSPLDCRRMPAELMDIRPTINLFKFVGIKPPVGEIFDEETRNSLMGSWEMMIQVDAICKGLDETGRIICVEVPTLFKQLRDAGLVSFC